MYKLQHEEDPKKIKQLLDELNKTYFKVKFDNNL